MAKQIDRYKYKCLNKFWFLINLFSLIFYIVSESTMRVHSVFIQIWHDFSHRFEIGG